MGKIQGQYSKVANPEDFLFANQKDGITVLISGFGKVGQPYFLIDKLIDSGLTDLTIVNNNAGNGDQGIAKLLRLGRVAKVICSFPRQPDSQVFDELYRAGKVDLELVPQGTLAERLRAGGAGIHGFYTAVSAGTELQGQKETRDFDGVETVLERPIKGDLALVKAASADVYGNLVYRKTARNFGPVMCAAATTTIVEVGDIVHAGALDPDQITTPSAYVTKLVTNTHQSKVRGEY